MTRAPRKASIRSALIILVRIGTTERIQNRITPELPDASDGPIRIAARVNRDFVKDFTVEHLVLTRKMASTRIYGGYIATAIPIPIRNLIWRVADRDARCSYSDSGDDIDRPRGTFDFLALWANCDRVCESHLSAELRNELRATSSPAVDHCSVR
ncbi:hypothetical protein GCM10027610_024520 [Dactylosporangium cerinum]